MSDEITERDVEALAVTFCNADQTWEHHEQTDDHPCSRCRRYAEIATEAISEARREGAADAWDEGYRAAISTPAPAGRPLYATPNPHRAVLRGDA